MILQDQHLLSFPIFQTACIPFLFLNFKLNLPLNRWARPGALREALTVDGTQ
jgi:hypothetical protein